MPSGAFPRVALAPCSALVSESMHVALLRSIALRSRCRSPIVGTVLFALIVASVWVAFPASSAESQQRATLRERLVFGLLAKIPSEIAFIDLVVLKVETGKLPERMVNQTFFWARERASPSENGSPRRPIIYFQPAMKARAKRIGVEL